MTPQELKDRLLDKGNAKILLSQEARDAIKKNVGPADLSKRYGGASVFSMQKATKAEALQEKEDAKISVFDMQEQGQYPAGGKDAESARIARSWEVVDPTIAPILEKGRVNNVVANAFFNGTHEVAPGGTPSVTQQKGKRADRGKITEMEEDLDRRVNFFMDPYKSRERSVTIPETIPARLTIIPDPSDPNDLLKGKYKWTFGGKGKPNWRVNPAYDIFAPPEE
jgi:hypothetical protein